VRLNSIKLAGFKSFAEPTNFLLPGQLVGVVGPNGCGKSNIMDAVRWVLGESRASELRGESMQDVIFNGTTQRKPASRASVELTFDNQDHRAGGQWSQFTEIAVKRVLTRDGTSSYYINNQAVRRRDVQDVFLGTGLGPRAYAIIGQGTISRIIESRPEELRLFLEEAAGVSKYKERRRETEHRLADTRENLTRVEDILRELNANLEKLEQQAAIAAKYHSLHNEATLRQHQLWFLKRTEAENQQNRIRMEGLQAVNDLEARMADLRHTEADIETLRQSHHEAGEQLHRALETEIRYVVQGRQRAQERLQQLEQQQKQWQARQQEAEAQAEALEGEGAAAEEQAELWAARLHEQSGQLPTLEAAVRTSQQQLERQRTAVLQLQQQIQLLAAEQRSLQEHIRSLEARHERLCAERNALATPDHAGLAHMRLQLTQAQEEAAVAEARLLELQDSVPQWDEERRACQQALNEQKTRQAEVAARLQALSALQEKVQTEGKLPPWLAAHGLDGLSALWQHIEVEPDWENALEAALRERLAALPLAQLERVGDFVAGQHATAADPAPPARLAFYSKPQTAAATAPQAAHGLPRLLDVVRTHDADVQAVLANWLQGCHTAPSLSIALSCRSQLAPGETIYLAAGHAVDVYSVAFYAPDSEQSGMLARAQEIAHLEKEVRAQAIITAETQAAAQRAETGYTEAVQQQTAAQQKIGSSQNQAHTLRVELLQLEQLAAQASERSAQIEADLAEVQTQRDDLHERSIVCEARCETLENQLAEAQEGDVQAASQVQEAERQLAECRQQQRTLERQTQEAQFTSRSIIARRSELARTLDMAHSQTQALREEQQRAQEELARLGAASAQQELQQALTDKTQREAELAACRSRHDELTARLRTMEEQRMRHEHTLEPLRQRITDLQLKEQAARLGVEQFDSLLQEAQANLSDVARSIEAGQVRIAGLQGEIDRLQQGIAALGAVNLAALDELTLARERHTFLAAQTEDLQQAMCTLEDAIQKIDAETRILLTGTFDTVNRHFGSMFPELFGGGQARLIMTGEEILHAGVQVMAQPPGKKNQTIHLLSGGEKALTAIALVFAIFQLNPAPFCLLDEVDAPLDDANTERYAKLVSSMSQGTQFLFISHNKIAMEMAGQLIGVTMQEQGVSRIVAVDMESALSLAHT